MKWKDSEDSDNLTNDSQSSFFDETDYPLWEKQKKSAFRESLFRKIEIPFLILGAGLIVLLVLFVISIFGKGRGLDASQFATLEKRLASMEDRLYKLEGVGGGQPHMEAQNLEIKQLQDKLEKIETAVSLRMDQISAEVFELQKKTSNVRLQKSPVAKTVKQPTKKQYHQVKSGETLYSIGRKYGVTIAQLLKLNNMRSDTIIHPGQKLVVGQTAAR